MIRIQKNGTSILSVDDWKRLAPPRRDDQWREHRSAMELARAWCPDGSGPTIPREIIELFRSHPDFHDCDIAEAIPEHKVPFDEISGEPRNSDLVAIGTACGRPFALSIEGKADEPFGKLVREELHDAAAKLAQDRPTRMINRINGLARAILPQRGGGWPCVGDLRYQLLTAAAGAIAYAKDCERAVLIIHEFRTQLTKDSLLADNHRDLTLFVQRVSGNTVTAVTAGQLLGPFELPGGGLVSPGTSFYIGKARRDLLTDPNV